MDIDTKAGWAWVDTLYDPLRERMNRDEVTQQDLDDWDELERIQGNLYDLLIDWHRHIRYRGYVDRTIFREREGS